MREVRLMILYTRPFCTACIELKFALDCHGVAYVERVVEPDDAENRPNACQLLSLLSYCDKDLDTPLPVVETDRGDAVTYPDCLLPAQWGRPDLDTAPKTCML